MGRLLHDELLNWMDTPSVLLAPEPGTATRCKVDSQFTNHALQEEPRTCLWLLFRQNEFWRFAAKPKLTGNALGAIA